MNFSRTQVLSYDTVNFKLDKVFFLSGHVNITFLTINYSGISRLDHRIKVYKVIFKNQRNRIAVILILIL